MPNPNHVTRKLCRSPCESFLIWRSEKHELMGADITPRVQRAGVASTVERYLATRLDLTGLALRETSQ
jgi:hypothetical protein